MPFIQISDNDHRSIIEQTGAQAVRSAAAAAMAAAWCERPVRPLCRSPRESRVTVYYKTKVRRSERERR